jgi:hypothetical protein
MDNPTSSINELANSASTAAAPNQKRLGVERIEAKAFRIEVFFLGPGEPISGMNGRFLPHKSTTNHGILNPIAGRYSGKVSMRLSCIIVSFGLCYLSLRS